jgi:CxxC-x17-CxxC domain-containing protein
MGKFDRGGFGGGKKFGGRDRSYDRDAPRQMFKAVCAECGNECEVPFKPSGDRPVLCSLCFKQSRGENGGDRRDDRREERNDFDRPRNENRKMYDTVCAKCGKPCQVPFQPKPGRDIFCSDCFSRDDKREAKPFASNQAPKSASYDNQFAALNAKLDKIINYLNPVATKPATVKPLETIIKKSASAKATVDKVEKTIVKKADKKVSKKKSTSAKATVDKASKKK